MKILTGMHRSGTSMTSNLLMGISGQTNFPEEHIGSATGKVREDSTQKNGERGALENLNETIKNHPKIKVL